MSALLGGRQREHAERSAVEWARLMFGPYYVGPRRLALVLSGYGDESGQGRTLSVAIYVAEDSAWDALAEEWRKRVLSPKRLPFLHMTGLVGRRSRAYRGWPEQDYLATFAQAAELIGRYTIIRAAVALDIPTYQQRMAEYRRGKPFSPASPYTYAVLDCLALIGDVATEQGISGDVGYVFENGANDWPQTAAVLALIQRDRRLRERFRLRSFMPGDKAMFPQLQAADVYAYLIREIVVSPSAKAAPFVKAFGAIGGQKYVYLHRPEQFRILENNLDTIIMAIKKQMWLKRRARKLGEST